MEARLAIICGGADLTQSVAEHSDWAWRTVPAISTRRPNSAFSPEQLEASGLFGKGEDGGLYDRFRGRLMFPIHNESGKVIAFGGRACGRIRNRST